MTDFKMYYDMASLLTPTERLKVFESYCQLLGKRIPERVELDNIQLRDNLLNGVPIIRKTDVYCFLPKDKFKKGGHIPHPETTAKFIIALKYVHEENALILDLLQPALNAMIRVFKRFSVEWFDAFVRKDLRSDVAQHSLQNTLYY